MKPCWLFVDSFPVFGGHEVMLLRLMAELSSQGRIRPRLLARRECRLYERGRDYLTPDSFAPRPPGRPGLWSRMAWAWRDGLAFLRTVTRLRPALCVVAENCLLSQALFVGLARLLGVRVIVYVPLVDTFAAMGFRWARLRDWLVRHGYAQLPDAWLTITPEQAHAFARWAKVRRPIHTLPNTVAPAIEALAQVPLPPHPTNHGRLRVLVLGRLEPFQKGLDLLLDHIETASLPPGLTIALVGDGPYAEEIQRRQRHNPALAGIVSLRPWSDPARVMGEHDLLLLPSRFEGVPLVMLEAMALGLPVVASDLPGTRAYLPETCLFPVGDLGAAFAIIQRLAVHEEERRAITDTNRRTFTARASGAAFAAAVAQLAEQLTLELAHS
ncbi:glycosyltransferase family 4 protein [Candidatus Methylocalor cossyra]|uniref:Uncharacterized protein n=1 Tax=Candidatus Methylocalor cossyra TaxID=3108543 RepID=A0ABM9NJQ8_9GAMM